MTGSWPRGDVDCHVLDLDIQYNVLIKHLPKLSENQRLQIIIDNEPFALVYKPSPSKGEFCTLETKTSHLFPKDERQFRNAANPGFQLHHGVKKSLLTSRGERPGRPNGGKQCHSQMLFDPCPFGIGPF